MSARAVPASGARRDSAGPAPPNESEALPKSPRKGPSVALYLAPGQKIADRYEIVQLLGEGGMGAVYSCRDRAGELCAVKRVVLPESNPEEHLGWFVAEAQSLASLNHPNVVRARDFGRLRDGTPYLAMDLVEGVLWQQISVQDANFPLLWTLVDQVLAALAHAHSRGIVHGDLKPSNVVVDLDEQAQPRARLFDFGLAKRKRSELDPRLGQAASASEPPTSAGTPGYMAPEQILGRTSEISGATDLYALGCMLYRVLAGRALAVHDGRADRDFHSFQVPPRPPALPGVAESLVDFVMSLLVLEPWRRVASAAEVRNAWQRFRPGTSRVPTGVISLLLGAAASLGNLERTRPFGPGPSRASVARLGRSNQWLPGLLSVRPSPLVGRNAEQRVLKELSERIERAGEAGQRAVLLTGPAGVGKSRLADWLCSEVEECGTAVSLRGFRHTSNVRRDPLALALSERFAAGRGTLRLCPGDLAERCGEAAVGAVVDWLARSYHPEVFGAGDASLSPHLVRVLGGLARGRPLVLWLDDLAAVSPETWEALLDAPALDPSLRFLLVSTARTETLTDAPVAHAVQALKAGLACDVLPVPPLDALTTSALLRAAHPVDPALALRISRESAGIPLDALSRLYDAARRGQL